MTHDPPAAPRPSVLALVCAFLLGPVLLALVGYAHDAARAVALALELIR